MDLEKVPTTEKEEEYCYVLLALDLFTSYRKVYTTFVYKAKGYGNRAFAKSGPELRNARPFNIYNNKVLSFTKEQQLETYSRFHKEIQAHFAHEA